MDSDRVNFILRPGWLETKIRRSIFTITGVCAGLPALGWSTGDLIHHRKNEHRISVFIILLRLIDFVDLLLSPYILIKIFLDDIFWYSDWTGWFFWALLSPSRVCGFLLHQLVALEGILSGKYPLYTASVFSSHSLTIFYILVFVIIFISHIFLPSVFPIPIVPLVLAVSLITWLLSCGASYSVDRYSHSSRKPNCHILVVFIFNLLVLYLPYILPLLQPHLHDVCFFMSVRLISDPLLCVLVCRQNLRIQTSINPEETSLV